MELRPLQHRLKAAANKADQDRDNEVTKIQYFPYEVLAQIMDYFPVMERQKLRLTCQSWNIVVSQLFDTPFRLTKSNAREISKTVCRILQVSVHESIGRKLEDIMRASPFYVRIQKLELKDIWHRRAGFPILKYTVSVKELVLKSKSLDYRDKEGIWAQEYEKTGEVGAWLPALRTLRFQASLGARQALRLIAKIATRGNLTSLIIDFYKLFPDPKQLMLDYIEGDVAVNKELPKTLSDYDLVYKILHWNRNSLLHVRFQPDSSNYWYDRVRLNTLAEIHLNPHQLPRDREVIHFPSFSGWLFPTDTDTPGRFRNEWNGSQNQRLWRNTFMTQNHLQELKLEFPVERCFDDTASALETLTAEIILRHSATLKTICLKFQPNPIFLDRAFVNNNFGTVFSRCVSLKRLEIQIRNVDFIRETRISPETFPKFRGIEILPESLTYFSTSLPIVSAENDLDQLNLTNLRNLRTLCMGSKAWFILNEVPLTVLTVGHLGKLKKELPMLKTIKLDITNAWNGRAPDEREQKEMAQNEWITPDLLEQFRDTLESPDGIGYFLTLQTSRL